MSKVTIKIIPFALSILLLVSITQIAYGENGNHFGMNYKTLGWIAIGAGMLANIPFILYIKAKKISIKELGGGDKLTRDLVYVHKPILNYHITLNLVGYVAGLIHGYFLIRGVDFISISLVIVMSVLTFSGIVLRFIKFREIVIFARILHTQIIMSGLLAVLIILHVLSER